MSTDLDARKSKFVEDATRVHEGKYTYDPSKYINISTKIPIKCPQHGIFFQSPRDHIYSGAGCQKCGLESRVATNQKKLKDSMQTFGHLYPELLAIWDYERNTLDPFAIPPQKRVKVHWLCVRGHRTYSSLGNKVRGSDCKFCSKAVSKLELKTYSLIKAMFDDALWSVKLNKLEADIFVPSQKLVVEVDGFPWHNSVEALRRDLRKYSRFEQEGLRLIRFRDNRNIEIRGEVFLFDSLRAEAELLRFFDYLSVSVRSEFSNEQVLQRMGEIQSSLLSRHPKPPFEKTLAAKFPELIKYWHHENLMDPDAITATSLDKVSLVCSQCNETFERSASGVRFPVYCLGCHPKHGVRKRLKQKILTQGSFAELHPELAEQWSSHNPDQPSEYLATSASVVLWTCEKHGDYKSAIRDRVRNGSGCHSCGKDSAAIARRKVFVVTSEADNSRQKELNGVKAVAKFIGCSEPMVYKMLKTNKSYLGYSVSRKDGK